jgi:hypothetical protein
MSTGTLELRRPEPGDASVKVGEAVTSQAWLEMGSLANWTRGKGAMLVPQCMPLRTVADGTTDGFRFRVKTRDVGIRRVWRLVVRPINESAEVTVKAPASTGTAKTVYRAISPVNNFPGVILYNEDLSGVGANETEITISVEAEYDDIIVESIACYEEDRPSISLNTNDFGVFLPSFTSGEPIADYSYRSISGVVDALANADARRVGILHWTQGDSEAAETTSSTAQDLFIPFPVLARKDLRTSTTGAVKWSAYAKVSSGGTGTIQVTTSESGVNDSATVTSTSFAWITSRSISIDAEDLAANDGRRGAAFDLLSCKISVTGGGSPKFTIKSFSVWED